MVRSMYSGVSGLRSHQTRMDTIGNNIANVNTYGFKSGRTTFRDIYYQSMKSASEPSAAAGGMNPSSVGYGSQVGSVDLMMGRSTFSMTDQTMDVAIDGDGFIQVEDAAGNKFYTRAGMLNFDAAGNLVDMQGNFVLGLNGDPTGRAPGSERIQVVLPPVPPTPASVVQSVNGLEFTISADNPTSDGNLNFNFTTDSSLADGEVQASITSNGIIIKMHPDNVYSNLNDLNRDINDAITKANGDQPHIAGRFTISYTGANADNPFSPTNMPTGGYKASDLVSVDYSIQLGNFKFGTNDSIFGGVYPTGTVSNTFGSHFTSDPPSVTSNFTAAYNAAGGGVWTFEMEIDGVRYRGEVDSSKGTSGKFMMRNVSDDADYFEMSRPGFGEICDAWIRDNSKYVAPERSTMTITGSGAPLATGVPHTILNVDGTPITVTFSAGATTLDAQKTELLAALNADATFTGAYNVSMSGNDIVITAKEAKEQPTTTQLSNGTWGTETGAYYAGRNEEPEWTAVPGGSSFLPYTPAQLGDGTNPPTATISAESNALGFSSTAFALRGGTSGGPQTIADMTGIAIAPNGVITGWDSQGKEITIGRIDIAVFPNPAGLNQAGTSNYTVSANSGLPVITQPGDKGAGKLVGGTLELSNVDLSREFSDMITTQRGYQANSRIITVSDTMLEELINLKR